MDSVSDRPWAHLRDEAKDGHWADYAAWGRWICAEENKLCGGDILGVLDQTDQANLYLMFCDVADRAAIAEGAK